MSTAEYGIKTRAIALNGTTVSVNLLGGQTLTGTLAYATTTTDGWPAGMTSFPDVLTVNVSTKLHTVRVDHVSSIG